MKAQEAPSSRKHGGPQVREREGRRRKRDENGRRKKTEGVF